MVTTDGVRIEVCPGDALTFRADVLVLKYAQALYGVDEAAYRALSRAGAVLAMPAVGEVAFHAGAAGFGSPCLLFVGTPRLGVFDYADIRAFGRSALGHAARLAAAAQHVALTLHGVGFGLDETEAFEAELAGIAEAVGNGDCAHALQRVSIVERDARRARRLQAVLARLVPEGQLGRATGAWTLDAATRGTLQSAGRASAVKPTVFVAMPFAPEMDDVFHYGIQGAANAAGLLCERADLASFTGDVVEWVKARISAARLVVADLSSANPNVYLEVGYAWGKGVPTVLLARQGQELKFDVKTQRCIVYSSIKSLEEGLARELKALAPGR